MEPEAAAVGPLVKDLWLLAESVALGNGVLETDKVPVTLEVWDFDGAAEGLAAKLAQEDSVANLEYTMPVRLV